MHVSDCVSTRAIRHACVWLGVLIFATGLRLTWSGSIGRPFLIQAVGPCQETVRGYIIGNRSEESRNGVTQMRRANIGSRLMLLPRVDGFGSHLHNVLSALAFCKTMNLTYVHMQWNTVDHCPPGQSRAKWSAELESFTGLVRDEIKFTSSLGPVPAIEWIWTDTDTYFNPQFLALMRKRYLSATLPKKTSDAFAATRSDAVRVAVHIRRGDVGISSFGHSSISRYTNNTQVLASMQLVERDIRANNKSQDAIFHIYSEGKPEAFADLVRAYGNARVFLHLGGDIKVSFHDMVSADVLIMAKSSFSYAAALLSEGIIYYQPFWHQGLSAWRMLPKL